MIFKQIWRFSSHSVSFREIWKFITLLILIISVWRTSIRLHIWLSIATRSQFYDIIIDSSASIRSIVDYEQYLTFIKNILLISLRWWYESSQYTDDVVYCWMSTRSWFYLLCDLYVRCVNHVIYTNLIRSDYLSIYLMRLIKSFEHTLQSLWKW
jgi:hypothetical protein